MTDNKNEQKGGDIYVTINNDNQVIDICKSTAGEDGFRTFIDRNVERVMNIGFIPNAYMVHFKVPDLNQVTICLG